MAKIRTNWKKLDGCLVRDVETLSQQIREEIVKRPKSSNVGKKGCLRRIDNILDFYHKKIYMIEVPGTTMHSGPTKELLISNLKLPPFKKKPRRKTNGG